MFPPLIDFNSDKYSPINFSICTYFAILAEQVKLAEENVKKPCFYMVFIGTKIALRSLCVLLVKFSFAKSNANLPPIVLNLLTVLGDCPIFAGKQK